MLKKYFKKRIQNGFYNYEQKKYIFCPSAVFEREHKNGTADPDTCQARRGHGRRRDQLIDNFRASWSSRNSLELVWRQSEERFLCAERERLGLLEHNEWEDGDLIFLHHFTSDPILLWRLFTSLSFLIPNKLALIDRHVQIKSPSGSSILSKTCQQNVSGYQRSLKMSYTNHKIHTKLLWNYTMLKFSFSFKSSCYIN